jgi:hypothetical protein
MSPGTDANGGVSGTRLGRKLLLTFQVDATRQRLSVSRESTFNESAGCHINVNILS